MQVTVWSPATAVMVTEPGATYVTVPSSPTVATFSLLEDQVTFSPSGTLAAFRRKVEPTVNREKSTRLRVIAVCSGAGIEGSLMALPWLELLELPEEAEPSAELLPGRERSEEVSLEAAPVWLEETLLWSEEVLLWLEEVPLPQEASRARETAQARIREKERRFIKSELLSGVKN